MKDLGFKVGIIKTILQIILKDIQGVNDLIFKENTIEYISNIDLGGSSYFWFCEYVLGMWRGAVTIF